MKPEPLSEFSAFVGIDWADKKHDLCVRAEVSGKSDFSVLPNKVEDIETWAFELHKKFPGSIAVAIELSKGPMVYALQKYDFLSFFQLTHRHLPSTE